MGLASPFSIHLFKVSWHLQLLMPPAKVGDTVSVYDGPEREECKHFRSTVEVCSLAVLL